MCCGILMTAVSDEINTALPVNVRPDTLYNTDVLRRACHFQTSVFPTKQTYCARCPSAPYNRLAAINLVDSCLLLYCPEFAWRLGKTT
jgi:hypothetical protein